MSRSFIKLFMALHTALYRLTGGKFAGQIRGFPILLLTTVGRKSGQARTTPLGFLAYEGAYVIIGSNGGADTDPAWVYNLRSNPRATIQVRDKTLEINAEFAGPDKRGAIWARLIEVAPMYANYEKATDREIPLVILRPV